MHKKILAPIIVMLLIVTVFNSSIIAKEDTSTITMTRDFINAKKKFEKLDVNDIKKCIETEDYSELLSFMGNNAKIVKNARINAYGKGYHFGKPIYYLGIKHPFLRIKRLGFPFGIIQQWIIYAKYTNESASTYVEPESGEPFYINGSHSIFVGIWFLPPIWRINTWINFLTLIDKLIKYPIFKDNFTIPFIEKWKGMPFIPWGHTETYNIPFLNQKIQFPWGVIEGLIMVLPVWPFRFTTSIIGCFRPIEFYGMTPFVIYCSP
jgi:hypothetical protein